MMEKQDMALTLVRDNVFIICNRYNLVRYEFKRCVFCPISQ